MKSALILTVIAMVLASCNPKVKTEKSNVDPDSGSATVYDKSIPGGWSDTEITPEVKEAVDFVVSRMNNASSLKEILSAKRQVVKGYNYEVTFRLENSSVWTAKVNRALDGTYTLLQEASRQ